MVSKLEEHTVFVLTNNIHFNKACLLQYSSLISVRAAETCKVDTDCANHTCHHGAPHCEIHDPNNEHGHCNCHTPHSK